MPKYAPTGALLYVPPLPISCDLAHKTVHLSVHVGNPHHAEHSPGLIDAGRQLVGPVRDAGPFGRVEEFFRRDVEGLSAVMRPTADTNAAQYQHIV